MQEFTAATIREGLPALFEILVVDHDIQPSWREGYRELVWPGIEQSFRWSYYFYSTLFLPADRSKELWNMVHSGGSTSAVRGYAERYLTEDEAAKSALLALYSARQVGDQTTRGFWSMIDKIPTS